jgi:hypothetical protein
MTRGRACAVPRPHAHSRDGFTPASPAVLLAAAADAAEEAARAGSSGNGVNGPATAALPASSLGPSSAYYSAFPLRGDAIPARAGLPGAPSPLSHGSSAHGQRASPAARLQPDALASPPLTARAARRLPPCVLMGSCADHMLPWHEGAEMAAQLRRCGVAARQLVYNHVGHGDFVVAWRPRAGRGEASGADLLPCAADLLSLVTGHVAALAECGSEVEGGRLREAGQGAARAGAAGGVPALQSRL